ncbi:hypothetical protein E2562_005932, partial [Oryza meyeriana var. granulata]
YNRTCLLNEILVLEFGRELPLGEKNNEAKCLYGVAFPHYDTLAAIYGRDIATGEGAEGLGEAVANMEKEIVVQDVEDEEDEESVSRETPRRSFDSILLSKLCNEELCMARS